jgi:hypothetical protein
MNKRYSTKDLAKVVLMIGVGLGGAASAFGASHGSHGGHASAAHRGHSGSSRGGHASAAQRGHSGGSHSGHASAANRGHSAGSHRGGTVHNHPHGGSAGQRNGHAGYHRNYHLSHGRQFRGGYYYPGRTHGHWAYTVFDARYGCTLYYDPGLTCYYYWCEPDDCYYPVSYCPYDHYVWSTAAEERPAEDTRQLQTDLDDLSAKLR